MYATVNFECPIFAVNAVVSHFEVHVLNSAPSDSPAPEVGISI